ncbi:uncharacterized protein DNG_02934 [Cephalotrichum gorgonifer]|uniref:Apple domain-containing protein n=1 Tax=Cephalotrichum gorgonifer TaxID=2041049 RepID=A0AAE8MUH0_9PEZI|nr:uncharacterized protein DNG_02934 [Cephalotrichum gorgonifer]
MPGQRASPAAGRSLSLSHAHSHAYAHARRHLPAMRLERRSSAPCPGADGETLGTGLILTVSCGNFLQGDVIATIDEATSFGQCADFCGTFHPRCDGVNYSERDGCRLIGEGGAEDSRDSRRDDSAVAQYPTLAASTCVDGQRLQASGFESVCRQVINGGDMVQRHQITYEGCAADCAGTSGCVAFSYDSSMSMGFMNCYLKSAVEDGSMSALDGIDSGVLNSGASPSAPTNGASPLPNSGGFLTIVPGGNAAIQPTGVPSSSIAVANPLPSSGNGSDDSSSTAPETEPPVVTRVITVPQDSPSGSAEAGSSQGSASLSWVAAPVVGGVAAMLVIGVLVIMFRKKRRNGARGGGVMSSSGSVGGGAGWKSMFTMSGARGSGINRGMQRLDDDSEGLGGVPVYEVKGGKVALREESGDGKNRPMTGLFRTST